MAAVIHLDTHVVVWLAAGELGRFPSFVPALLHRHGCSVSPMVCLELDFLREIGRLKIAGESLLQSLSSTIRLRIDQTSFADVVAAASPISWTRGPFDRLFC